MNLKWVLEKKMGLAFILTMLAILSTLYFIVQNNRNYKTDALWVKHTLIVLNKCADVYIDLKNIQTDQLNYIVTSDSNFLSSYKSLKDSIIININQLKQLTEDNKNQQININILLALSNKILAVPVLAKNKINESVIKENLIKQNRSIGQLGELINLIQTNEKRLLLMRQIQRDKTINNSTNGFYTLCGGIFLIFVIVFFARERNKRRFTDFGNKEENFKVKLQEQADLKTSTDLSFTKELAQYNYVISHDLKEPLRMVTSFMTLLQKGYSAQLDEKANTYINFAVDGGKRMQKMIADMLKYSRAGQSLEGREEVDLAALVEEVLLNLYKQIEECNAEIISKIYTCKIAIYKGEIIRLLQNLISNAIKFSKNDIKPVITISCKEQMQDWLVTIEDNGIGIAKENHQKIFEVFSRLHSADEYEGSGIGLAICKKITDQHNGKIWVESVLGKGSIFYFTINKKLE